MNVHTDFTTTQTASGSTSTSGTVTIDRRPAFTVSGSTFNYQGGTIAGGGTLSFANGAAVGLAFGTVLTNNGAFTLAAVSTTFNGPGSLANTAGAALNLRARHGQRPRPEQRDADRPQPRRLQQRLFHHGRLDDAASSATARSARRR